MSKHNSLLFFILIIIVIISCKDNYKINDSLSRRINSTEAENNQSDTNQFSVKNFDYFPTSTTGQIVNHPHYTLSYSEEHEQAEWVAYELKSGYSSTLNLKRPYFNEDPKVKSGSADWRNYKNSGYDKGHLCPAGDMKFSKEAYNATFYTSNISPQKSDFNAGVWNRLEQKVRYWADKYDGLYVVTGGILEPDLKTIGEEEVSVPNYFYKVLLDVSRKKPRIIAFVVPHKNSSRPLYEFVVSVDELEELTGIDFFHNLPDDIENKIEKSSDYKDWSFN